LGVLAQPFLPYLRINFPNCRCQEIALDGVGWIGNDGRIAWEGLRVADSLIIASGLEVGVDLFVSNDHHFKKAIPDNMMLAFD
jgi:hypothetical protein